MKKKMVLLLVSLLISFPALAVIDLNKASQIELETLTGIGPTKAKAIIEYRKTHGGFNNIEELQKVDGIGPSTYKKISKDITVTNKLKEVPSKGRISSSIEYE